LLRNVCVYLYKTHVTHTLICN